MQVMRFFMDRSTPETMQWILKIILGELRVSLQLVPFSAGQKDMHSIRVVGLPPWHSITAGCVQSVA